MTIQLGTTAAADKLIQELYLELRAHCREWAKLTEQTGQARMGYVGQHLVSVVTGFKGGKSGARGEDLKLPDGKYAEIKTCYRVDQLGACKKCGSKASEGDATCASCGSEDIKRNDDSKWLIGIRHDDEFDALLAPEAYYFVLFEYNDIAAKDHSIVASIWRVDPKVPGFALCLIDYYRNIRAKSTSKAPFNLWPHSLKFELTRPRLIYEALIPEGDHPTIQTRVFPGRNERETGVFSRSGERATTITADHLRNAYQQLTKQSPPSGAGKAALIEALKDLVLQRRVTNAALADALALEVYADVLLMTGLPKSLSKYLTDLRGRP